MMKLGGNSLEREAVNFLPDKVGKPHITAYVNRFPPAQMLEKPQMQSFWTSMLPTYQQAGQGLMIVEQHRQQKQDLR